MSGWHWLLVCWLTPGVLTLALLVVGTLVRGGGESLADPGDRSAATTTSVPAVTPRPDQPVAA